MAVRLNRLVIVDFDRPCKVLLTVTALVLCACQGPVEVEVERKPLVPCWYSSAATQSEDESGMVPNCATLDESGLTMVAEHLQAATGGTEMASVRTEDSWYYVLPDGRSLAVLTYDNGPDYFAGGLVRARSHDKIGYYDENLELVLAPRYDWGWPFENGLALVCVGCVAEKLDHEEHTTIIGGEWGVIDTSGEEVVPFRKDRDEVYSRFREMVTARDP